MSKINEIPIWGKYTLSVEEATAYFCIGEGKLRQLIEADKRPNSCFRTVVGYKSRENYLGDLLPCIRNELPVAGPVGDELEAI